MTTTRSFPVEVTGCKNCPFKVGYTHHCLKADMAKGKEIYRQNVQAITPSCPNWNISKEKDVK